MDVDVDYDDVVVVVVDVVTKNFDCATKEEQAVEARIILVLAKLNVAYDALVVLEEHEELVEESVVSVLLLLVGQLTLGPL